MVEAMAAGRPVVASAIDGIRDAVIDGETALLAPPTDAVAVACHLERLLSDHNLRRALGSRGRSMARQNYGAAAAMEQLEAAYSRLVSGEMRAAWWTGSASTLAGANEQAVQLDDPE